jgi:HEAT repeat protein
MNRRPAPTAPWTIFAVAALLAGGAALAADREEEVAKYVKQLKSKDGKSRAAAAEEIGKVGMIKASYAKPALEPLVEALSDKDAFVRAAAATALARLDEPKTVVPELTKLLKQDKDMRVRVAAAGGLGLMGPASKEAIPTLRQVGQEARSKGKQPQRLAQACMQAIRQITGRNQKD